MPLAVATHTAPCESEATAATRSAGNPSLVPMTVAWAPPIRSQRNNPWVEPTHTLAGVSATEVTAKVSVKARTCEAEKLARGGETGGVVPFEPAHDARSSTQKRRILGERTVRPKGVSSRPQD